MPTTEDTNKAREQATQALTDAIEQARTPLLAALGAGDIAAHAIVDALNKVREQADQAYAELSGDPVELRKRIDAYAQSAAQLYGYLANRGEETLEKLRTQPPVKTAQAKVEDVVEDVRDVADDVLGKVSQVTETPKESGAERTTSGAEQKTKSSTKTSTGTKTTRQTKTGSK